MNISRRCFISSTLSTAAFIGLRRHIRAEPVQAGLVQPGYGPVQPDANGILDLPAGFEYGVISRTGETMSDGFLVPGSHDGMAAFAGPLGKTILVRNHELTADSLAASPFGSKNELLSRLSPASLYDGAPGLGGATTLVYDTRRRRLEKHFLSLAGTIRNCAGGVTPWGSWISCEETVQLADSSHQKNHGFNFEIPATAGQMAAPVPLKAMGRFYHEAIAVDRASGVVYQTEDRSDGLLYRFIPSQPGELAAGGRLQALKIRDLPGVDTSNWLKRSVPVGTRLEVDWVDLQNVESPDDDLRMQGAAAGAARFSRGEGMSADRSHIYFTCTRGGPARGGQVWRYAPSRYEGTARETENYGTLELFIETNDTSLLGMADNITVSPWGDLILCEDGSEHDNIVGVDPQGNLYCFARNAMNASEFAGASFSPDGTTLFVNIQNPGLTLAITGPWKKARG